MSDRDLDRATDRRRDELLALCGRCDAARCRGALSALRALLTDHAYEEWRVLVGECVVACADAAGPAPDARIETLDAILDEAGAATINAPAALADFINYRRAADGRTMLLVCALQNRPRLIAHVVGRYVDVIDPLISTQLEESPLFVASRWYHMQCVEALLGHAPTVKSQTNKRVEDGTEFTCLHLACFHGKRELVTLLLLHDADVHAVDSRGDQPLHLASRHGYPEIIELLVRAGASLHVVNHIKKRPVDIAIAAGKLECQLLLYEYMELEVSEKRPSGKKTPSPPKTHPKKNALTPSASNGSSKTASRRSVQRTGRLIPPPPFSFSPERTKAAYAKTPFHFRASKHNAVDDVRRDYLARWRKSYSMAWPESLLSVNQGEDEAQVSEFVHHTCRCLPADRTGVWGRVRLAFFKAHHRAPFSGLDQASRFLEKLVKDARLVATGDEDSLRRQRERQKALST